MNAVHAKTAPTIIGMLEAMNQRIRDLDGSKLWLPITVVVLLCGGTFSLGVWATGVSSKLNTLETATSEIKGSLQTISELAGQVNRNSGRLDVLQNDVASQEIQVQSYIAWLQTTQVALARQGFATPDLPKPTPPPQKGN